MTLTRPKPILILLGSYEAGKCAFLEAVASAYKGEVIKELFDGTPIVVLDHFVLVPIRPNTIECTVYAPIARAAMLIERVPGGALPSTAIACAVRRGPDLLRNSRETTTKYVACNLANPLDVSIALRGLIEFSKR
jgi:hypothetical protein